MKYAIATLLLCLSHDALARPVLYCASFRPITLQNVTTSELQQPITAFKDGSQITCNDPSLGDYFFYSVKNRRFKVDPALCRQAQQYIESDYMFRFVTRAAFSFDLDFKNQIVRSIQRAQVYGGGCGSAKNP